MHLQEHMKIQMKKKFTRKHKAVMTTQFWQSATLSQQKRVLKYVGLTDTRRSDIEIKQSCCTEAS